MFLLACLNIAGTAMIPESNWFLSFTVLFGVLIGCPLEFWCEEYSRWLVREEDGRHYSRQLAEWERWSAERLREDKEREAAAVPEWLAARRESARNGEGVGVPEWSAAGQSAGAVLSDLVDELLAEAGGYYDAEQPEGHGSQDRLHSASDDAEAVDEEDEEYVEYSPVEIANAEVYRLFYTPHLYHLPTTLFLLVRTAFLPFLALAPIWAAVTAVETTTNPMNSWSLAVGGVPWIAVAPSAAAAIAVAAVVPLWALWSENRVTGRGVEKDWAWLRWLPCIAFFFAFLGCFLAGLLGASKFVDGNGAYPVPTTIGYLMDSSLPFGTASATMFFSMDEAVYTPFTAQFMQFPIAPESFHLVQTSPYLDYGRGMLGLRVKGRQTLQANAPLWSLTTPSVGVVSDLYADNNTDTTKRNLTLLIGGPRGSVHWSVQITAPANVVGLQVWDHKVDLSRPPQRFVTSGAGGAGSAAFSRFHLDCIPCPPDGLQVSMILSSTAGNTTVRMSETGWGLPWKDSSMAFPPFPWEDRSAKEMMGGLWGMSDPTVGIRTRRGVATQPTNLSSSFRSCLLRRSSSARSTARASSLSRPSRSTPRWSPRPHGLRRRGSRERASTPARRGREPSPTRERERRPSPRERWPWSSKARPSWRPRPPPRRRRGARGRPQRRRWRRGRGPRRARRPGR
ncbi:hypothetical protein DFJ74DRAFT_502444 [Hyaloraphidium curvatum]|nr:hypothetical protein DFJ74DRAFT_502444 [Hyaloraphidium curvatum]